MSGILDTAAFSLVVSGMTATEKVRLEALIQSSPTLINSINDYNSAISDKYADGYIVLPQCRCCGSGW